MTTFLNYIIMLVSGWLIISPLILGYSNDASIAVCVGIGLFVIVLAFISNQRKTDQWPSMVTVVMGIFLVLWAAFLARVAGVSYSCNDIAVGILFIILGLIIIPFKLDVTKVKLYNRNGGELGVMTQIRMKNDDILAKTVLLGSMSETIYMRPEEICKTAAMIDMKVILALPMTLYKGWKMNRTQTKGNQ